MTPFNTAFWASFYEPTAAILRETAIDPVQVAITVLFMLILPLCIGILCHMRFPQLTAKIRKPLQWLSMAIFVAFIVLALAANWGFFPVICRCGCSAGYRSQRHGIADR